MRQEKTSLNQRGKTMLEIAKDLPPHKLHIQWLGAWLKPFPTKWLARLTGASVHTVRKWKEGASWPSVTALAVMIDTWGAAFFLFVFRSSLKQSDLDVLKGIDALDQNNAILEKELLNAASAARPAKSPRTTISKPRQVVRTISKAARNGVTSALVAVGIVGWLSVVLPQQEDMGRARTRIVRVVRSKTEVV